MLNNCKISLIAQYEKYSKRSLNAAVVLLVENSLGGEEGMFRILKIQMKPSQPLPTLKYCYVT